MEDTTQQTPISSESTDLPEIDFSPYRLTPKFESWRQLYLDKNNKETFGNATQSALKAYNLDPNTQYGAARVIGHENLTKLNNLRLTVREYLEENGFTLPVLINHAIQMMVNPKVITPLWWREIMKLAGYIIEKPTVAVQNNLNVNNKTEQVSPEELKQLNQDFADFIRAKAKSVPALNPDTISRI
jgi:hypothetical protein